MPTFYILDIYLCNVCNSDIFFYFISCTFMNIENTLLFEISIVIIVL